MPKLRILYDLKIDFVICLFQRINYKWRIQKKLCKSLFFNTFYSLLFNKLTINFVYLRIIMSGRVRVLSLTLPDTSADFLLR